MKDVNLEHPWALTLLLLIPAIIYLKQKLTIPRGFSAVSLISKELEPGFIQRHSLAFLACMFLVSSILAVVNIQYASIWQKTFLESKWIMIVQDLSGSMNRIGDEHGQRTLGDISIEGVRAFINMRHKDDLIGLIAFSSYAKVVSPPTFDKQILQDKLTLLNRDSDSIIFRELALGGATNASYATWLALCTFFMLLPDEHRLSFVELKDFRHSLLGRTIKKIQIPDKLKKIKFGHGMAIVLFTDGRIEANQSDADVRKGLPNFINVVQLLKRLGVKLYLIVVSGDVNDEVKTAMNDADVDEGAGRIFYMPQRFNPEKIKAVYRKIHEMEKNRLLVKIFETKKDTRRLFAMIAMGFLALFCFIRLTPWVRGV